MRFFARIALTHLGARPRPLHFSEPLGCLYLKATFERLSFFCAATIFALAGRPLLATDLRLLRFERFWPMANSGKSLTESPCFFKIAKIALAAAFRLERSSISRAILRADSASSLSDIFDICFIDTFSILILSFFKLNHNFLLD